MDFNVFIFYHLRHNFLTFSWFSSTSLFFIRWILSASTTTINFPPCHRGIEYAHLILYIRVRPYLLGCAEYDTKLHPVTILLFWSSGELRVASLLPLLSPALNDPLWLIYRKTKQKQKTLLSGPLLPNMIVPIKVQSLSLVNILKIICIRQEYLKPFYCVQNICIKNN